MATQDDRSRPPGAPAPGPADEHGTDPFVTRVIPPPAEADAAAEGSPEATASIDARPEEPPPVESPPPADEPPVESPPSIDEPPPGEEPPLEPPPFEPPPPLEDPPPAPPSELPPPAEPPRELPSIDEPSALAPPPLPTSGARSGAPPPPPRAPAGSSLSRAAAWVRRRPRTAAGLAALGGLALVVLAVAALSGFFSLERLAPGEEEAPETAAAEAAAGGAFATGVLVEAVPWGEVVEVVDGRGDSRPLPADASTPLPLELPPGSYEVRLRHPERSEELTCRVDVARGALAPCRVVFFRLGANDYFRRAGWWR